MGIILEVCFVCGLCFIWLCYVVLVENDVFWIIEIWSVRVEGYLEDFYIFRRKVNVDGRNCGGGWIGRE